MNRTFRLPRARRRARLLLPSRASAKGLFATLAAVGVLMLAACATPQAPPSLALQAAEQAIANADRARVSDTAAPELDDARKKLAAAKLATHAENMDTARRLADESRLSAELAIARNETAKARVVNEDMKKSADTLQQELQRKTGARP